MRLRQLFENGEVTTPADFFKKYIMPYFPQAMYYLYDTPNKGSIMSVHSGLTGNKKTLFIIYSVKKDNRWDISFSTPESVFISEFIAIIPTLNKMFGNISKSFWNSDSIRFQSWQTNSTFRIIHDWLLNTYDTKLSELVSEELTNAYGSYETLKQIPDESMILLKSSVRNNIISQLNSMAEKIIGPTYIQNLMIYP